MVTRIVGFGDRFCNLFTKSGRQINRIYRDMGNRGLHYIRQRNLPNGAKVILGYKNAESEYANHAWKVNSDRSTKQNTFSKMYGFNDYIIREKIEKDSKGELINQQVSSKMYKNGEVVGQSSSTRDKTHSTAFVSGKYLSLKFDNWENIKNFYRKESTKNSDYYQIIRYTDGKIEYKKSVNGVEYFSVLKG